MDPRHRPTQGAREVSSGLMAEVAPSTATARVPEGVEAKGASLQGWALDGALALLLVVLAWRLLTQRDLFAAVVLFIALGLVLALVWVRLEAPDIALAEVALGTGVTGALFLNALWRPAHKPQRPPSHGPGPGEGDS
jgi:energy-converting hydrogenase B subunit D